MPFYPIHKELKDLSRHMPRGNFGLWYNKFVPLNNADACKPSDDRDDKDSENRPIDHYFNIYGQMKNNSTEILTAMLKRKHEAMDDFCGIFPPDKFKEIVICATLLSPLITGIGESHPHEISMVFDHNMGIPYIPASGVKGIVRFAHTLALIAEAETRGEINDERFFNDEEHWTFVPLMFGTQTSRGKVVFLDAYPEKIPDLHKDIMNPHYAPYYSDDRKEPPADYHQPNPIKFLTVKAETTFIFRAVAERVHDLPEKVETAFAKALTEEGVGAKTSVGYGRFRIDKRTPTAATSGKVTLPLPEETHAVKETPPSEETWDDAYVSFNAGGGGVVTVQATGGGKAELRGKDKALATVAESLHKKLFEKQKNIPKARVTIRKVGNHYEIIRVEAMDP